MLKSDFSTKFPDDGVSAIHFVGIGGAGMSGIAQLMLGAGFKITGSDLRETEIVQSLRNQGVIVSIGHNAQAISGADALVVSGAVADDNPEVVAARLRNIPVVHRAVALEWLTRGKELIAVAGAHGKTTSTAMIVTALFAMGRDISFVNGGAIKSFGTSARHGADEIFVIEADESDGSFLLYDTSSVLITNVDPDHLDHFGSEDAFENAFANFAKNARNHIVISADDPGAKRILPRLTARNLTTFGFNESATVRIDNVNSAKTVSFDLHWRSQQFHVELRAPGVHNAINAAGVFSLLVELGFSAGEVIKGLECFEGTERRFELRGDHSGVRVFDDFAHHPTEVRAALLGARAAAGTGRLITIFQPHLFSRTRLMAEKFAQTFDELSDHTIVMPIYPAREAPEPGVTGQLIADASHTKNQIEYRTDWHEAANRAAEISRPGDLIITMGGGDVYGVVPLVLEALTNKNAASEAP
ncbi:MAG: UDP-N-acetylmuramate--L-alanine ligase [Microbacteriaceae bacterium]|nr:UDP-N-acetylmuramate--L-alanine ligase [Microbacteriaceae bacterium]